MARPKRDEPYDLGAAIKTTARRMIAENGASSLSLRAIGRELNITAPAIYNYFRRRDDLITALILDSFSDLGENLIEAHTPHREDDASIQLRIICQAYRRWAMDNPDRYFLMFSTPIPGYQPPQEGFFPMAAKPLAPLIATLEYAQKNNSLRQENLLNLPSGITQPMQKWKQVYTAESDLALYLAVTIWSRVHGLVMNEINHRFPPYIVDAGELFRHEIKDMALQYLV